MPDALLRAWITWQRRLPKRETAPVLGMLLWTYGGAPTALLVEAERYGRRALGGAR